jgi:hypothetical protein
MAYEQLILGSAAIRWADLPAAQAAFCVAAQATPEQAAALDRQGWAAQERATRETVTALSCAYRYLTLPPRRDLSYVLEYGNSFASHAAQYRVAALLARMGETGLPPEAFGTPPPASAADYADPVVIPWAKLGASGEPLFWPERDPEGDATNPRRGFDGLYTGCGQAGGATQGCDPLRFRGAGAGAAPAGTRSSRRRAGRT